MDGGINMAGRGGRLGFMNCRWWCEGGSGSSGSGGG